jgi:hypothetical protein
MILAIFCMFVRFASVTPPQLLSYTDDDVLLVLAFFTTIMNLLIYTFANHNLEIYLHFTSPKKPDTFLAELSKSQESPHICSMNIPGEASEN